MGAWLLMETRAQQLAAAVMLALALAGCQDPYKHEPQHRARVAASAPHSTPEPGDVARPGPKQPAMPYLPAASSRARGAAMAFAIRWTNWDWRNAAAQQRALAHLAAGSLAAQLRSSAQTEAADSTLTRDKPSSRGQIAAVDLTSRRHRAAGLVVTHEQSYTDGHADLGGAHYHVYLTALERDGRRWEIMQWEPQP